MRNLFALNGRLGHRAYWLGLVLYCAAFVLSFFLVFLYETSDRTKSIVYVALYIVLAWLTGRRMADMDLSPAAIWILILVATFCNLAIANGNGRNHIELKIVIFLFGALAPLLAALILGFLRGSVGHNRFGPSLDDRATLDAAAKLFD